MRSALPFLLLLLAATGCFLADTGTSPADELYIIGLQSIQRGDTTRFTTFAHGDCDYCYDAVLEATWTVTPSSLASIAAQPLDRSVDPPAASALLKAIAPGLVTIKARSGKKEGRFEVRVFPLIESVTLSSPGGAIRVGDTVSVRSQMRFENDAQFPDYWPVIGWRLFPDAVNDRVADMSQEGRGDVLRIIGRAPGTVLVTAGFLGKFATASFRVNAR